MRSMIRRHFKHYSPRSTTLYSNQFMRRLLGYGRTTTGGSKSSRRSGGYRGPLSGVKAWVSSPDAPVAVWLVEEAKRRFADRFAHREESRCRFQGLPTFLSEATEKGTLNRSAFPLVRRS
jgi:hypothetical protein